MQMCDGIAFEVLITYPLHSAERATKDRALRALFAHELSAVPIERLQKSKS